MITRYISLKPHFSINHQTLWQELLQSRHHACNIILMTHTMMLQFPALSYVSEQFSQVEVIGDVISSIHGLHTWFFRSNVSLDICRMEFPFLPIFPLIISYLWLSGSNAHSDTLSSVDSFISNSNLRLLPAKSLCRSTRVMPWLPASLITVSCKTWKKMK